MGAFEDEDEEGDDHVDGGDGDHDDEDGDDVEVEEFEPFEDVVVLFFDGFCVEGGAGFGVNFFAFFGDVGKVVDEDFESADLVWGPFVDFLDVADVSYYICGVEFLESGVVDSGDFEDAEVWELVCFFFHEEGVCVVADFEV